MVPDDPLTEVVVFGREPRPNEVKTRLAAAIGGDRAARLYRALLEHTLAEAVRSGFATRLSLAAEPVEPPTGVVWEVQPDADLGERLELAFDRAYQRGARRVLVVGSDCPELDATHLRSAADALDHRPLVLGPAADGGFWLIGQRAPGTARLLHGVPWSTDRVLAATAARARALGVDPVLLDELVDVDRFEDVAAVRARGRMHPRVDAAIRCAMDL